MVGDINATAGNQIIDRLHGTRGESALNIVGQQFTDFATFNELEITNTFFRHKYILSACQY